jgi:hypothetical protein
MQLSFFNQSCVVTMLFLMVLSCANESYVEKNEVVKIESFHTSFVIDSVPVAKKKLRIDLKISCLVDSFKMKIQHSNSSWQYDFGEIQEKDRRKIEYTTSVPLYKYNYSFMQNGERRNFFILMPYHKFIGKSELYFNIEQDFENNIYKKDVLTLTFDRHSILKTCDYTRYEKNKLR